MEPQGGISTNLDGSKNLTLGLAGDHGSAGAFVHGYKDSQQFPKPTGPSFGSAGGNITMGSQSANIGVTATHIPHSANQLSASTNLNLVDANRHKVDVNAFTTKTFPKGPAPNFNTHGAGVNYSYNDTVHAGASIAHTPMFKHTQQSVNAGVNLMNTPNSSLSLNAGVSRSQNPFHNSGWQPGGSMVFRKQF
ncbi:attacin-B [Amyelois transitella]|uniref:attacin-B n=1 Tax=Amyelois transitella TaxID=680683 RepID=UPI00067BEB92|nr:attacin-B [Amyelois transitella]